MTNVEGRFAGQSGNTGCRHTTLQQADEIRSVARLVVAEWRNARYQAVGVGFGGVDRAVGELAMVLR